MKMQATAMLIIRNHCEHITLCWSIISGLRIMGLHTFYTLWIKCINWDRFGRQIETYFELLVYRDQNRLIRTSKDLTDDNVILRQTETVWLICCVINPESGSDGSFLLKIFVLQLIFTVLDLVICFWCRFQC